MVSASAGNGQQVSVPLGQYLATLRHGVSSGYVARVQVLGAHKLAPARDPVFKVTAEEAAYRFFLSACLKRIVSKHVSVPVVCGLDYTQPDDRDGFFKTTMHKLEKTQRLLVNFFPWLQDTLGHEQFKQATNALEKRLQNPKFVTVLTGPRDIHDPDKFELDFFASIGREVPDVQEFGTIQTDPAPFEKLDRANLPLTISDYAGLDHNSELAAKYEVDLLTSDTKIDFYPKEGTKKKSSGNQGAETRMKFKDHPDSDRAAWTSALDALLAEHRQSMADLLAQAKQDRTSARADFDAFLTKWGNSFKEITYAFVKESQGQSHRFETLLQEYRSGLESVLSASRESLKNDRDLHREALRMEREANENRQKESFEFQQKALDEDRRSSEKRLGQSYDLHREALRQDREASETRLKDNADLLREALKLDRENANMTLETLLKQARRNRWIDTGVIGIIVSIVFGVLGVYSAIDSHSDQTIDEGTPAAQLSAPAADNQLIESQGPAEGSPPTGE